MERKGFSQSGTSSTSGSDIMGASTASDAPVAPAPLLPSDGDSPAGLPERHAQRQRPGVSPMTTRTSHPRGATKPETIRRSTVLGVTAQDRANPYNRIVCVPHNKLVHTEGLAHYGDDLRVVCLDYQTGSCREGSRCMALHVDPLYLLRTRMPQEPACCGAHDDAFSQECLPRLQNALYNITLPGGTEVLEVHPSKFAITESLPMPATPEGRYLFTIDGMHVCRKHFQGLCKYSKECRNVHLCRELRSYLENTVPDEAIRHPPQASHPTPPSQPTTIAIPLDIINALQQQHHQQQHQVMTSSQGHPLTVQVGSPTAVTSVAGSESSHRVVIVYAAGQNQDVGTYQILPM